MAEWIGLSVANLIDEILNDNYLEWGVEYIIPFILVILIMYKYKRRNRVKKNQRC